MWGWYVPTTCVCESLIDDARADMLSWANDDFDTDFFMFLYSPPPMWWWKGYLPHYTKGRKPGQYPSFGKFRDSVHPVLDLYDPFGFNKKMSEETKERRLIAEINNGRLAQLGIFGFLAADKVPGSVPLLTGIVKGYSGNPMIPFEGQFSYVDYIGGPN